MILIFSIQLDLLPTSGRPVEKPIPTQIRYIILPALVLGFDPWAAYLRLTRSAFLEVLDSEYIKFARAKGVSTFWVIWKHGLRNALIQPLTVSTLLFASFITGAVFAETIFAWPGLGRLAVTATIDNDFPVVSAIVLLFGVIYVVMNLVADVAYAYVDPRIRYR
jgi:peptide/nickel transport system permease protein